MKHRLIYLFKLYLIFLAFAFLSKLLFLLFNYNLTAGTGWEWIKIFYHGLRLDLSASAYFMILPMLAIIVSSILRRNFFNAFMPWYFAILIILLSLTLVADIELYKYWGFRLDVTPLLYLKTPREAMASASLGVFLRQFLIAVLIVLVFIYVFRKVLGNGFGGKYKWYEIPVYLFFFAALIIPIRGGFGIAPINVGAAYFSGNSYLNHAAINVFWNLGNSFADLGGKTNKYQYFDVSEAKRLVDPYLNANDTTGLRILNNQQPNILVIILESFTANVIKPLNGLPDVTPEFNRLSGEGVLFTSCYASGDRTDKGLISILSGYPAQATFSVIKDAARTQRLPKLPLELKNMGYNTAFYYGGDLDFANMRSYLVSSGFSRLISKNDFRPETYNSKWGSHDDVVFNKLFTDLQSAASPFFKVFLTLSSHEPFEVPTRQFAGNDEHSRYLNSVMYTDSCLGDFIAKAKKEPWWENTLVIFIADHGSRHPNNLPVHVPGKFYIPMLWTGGALKQSLVWDKPVSQADLPATLLNQLNLPFDQYLFSRNIFGEKQQTDVFYLFNNGIGMVNDTAKLVYDCTKQALQLHEGNGTEILKDISKAYIQMIYHDLNSNSPK